MTMHAGVSRVFESLMFPYYMKHGMKNVGQSARLFYLQTRLPDTGFKLMGIVMM